MVLMYYMLLQKGKKKGAITVGARTSGQVAACGRVASTGGGSGSTAGKGNGATGRGNGATGTGSVAGGNGASSSGGGASRKAKVVMVPTVEKVIERIAAKKEAYGTDCKASINISLSKLDSILSCAVKTF